MSPPDLDGAPRPIARLRLLKVPADAARQHLPVFHVFEELYERALREMAPRQPEAVAHLRVG